MSRIAIYYFTGTGNTAHAVKKMKEAFIQGGHRVVVRQITKDAVSSSGDADQVLVAYPTLSLSAPVMVKRFLRSLAPGRGRRAAVLALTGGTYYHGQLGVGNPGQGLMQIEAMLRRRGYTVFLTRSVPFPENFTQIMEPPAEEDVLKIITHGDKLVDSFIQDFLVEKQDLHRVKPLRFIFTRFLAVLYGLVGRRALGKLYVADPHCNSCGICARACPAGTIRMKGGVPRWGFTCEDCNRCINICPQQSIQLSLPLLIFHVVFQAAAIIWFIPFVLGMTLSLMILAPALQIVLGVLGFLLLLIFLSLFQMTILDGLIFLLGRWRPAQRFLSLGWTRRFRRYTAPGFKPLKPL